jgi:menaquinone-dependent protoporphyrinogen oxidase
LASRIGARGHRTFGGRLDENAKGFIARAMVRNGRGGDFRDRALISAWAREIAAALPQLAAGRTEAS